MDIPVQVYAYTEKHTQSSVTPDPEYFQIHIQLRFYPLINKTHNLLGTLQQRRPFRKHPPRAKDEQSLEKQKKKPSKKMDIFEMGLGERC